MAGIKRSGRVSDGAVGSNLLQDVRNLNSSSNQEMDSKRHKHPK